MDNFQPVLRFFMNQKATIGYSFMALLTIGGERIFSMVSFQCPCNRKQNFAYGMTFLLGPAAVLLVLGLFFSTGLWRLYTGCCLNATKLCPRGNCFGCLRALISILTGACVAPVMWLCVALLNGTFYECAISGLSENFVVELFCKNKTVTCQQELARILGWCIIIVAAFGGLVGTCCTNCRSKVSFLQLTFWKRYVEKEKASFDSFAMDYAAKLAERNLKSFFENKEPEPFPFPSHKAWEEISAHYTFSRSEQCYSTLQQYVERDRDFPPEKRPVMDPDHGIEML
ncbi:Protein FAM26E [Liparis tanakae]|uniref:Protein FAM26E n=1 Tax=Liparis tanakae TaxID=230148 RepID=A0A4Z2EIT5_9TELE|nr:Protein FAM26E [Liparis tanakae]